MHAPKPQPIDDRYELALLGRAIRDVRETQRISSSELASASGIAIELIDALEAGRLDPTYDLLLVLADGLSVRVAAFAERVEELRSNDSSPATQ